MGLHRIKVPWNLRAISLVLHQVKIHALFGENIKESELPVRKELFALPYVETIVAGDIPENRRILKSMHDNEEWFTKACVNRDVNYSIRSHYRSICV